MRNILILCALIICSLNSVAQQTSSNDPDPRVFYDKGILHIEPASYKLVLYDVAVLKKHGDLVGPYRYNVERPSPDALNLIQMAKPGDTIFFEEIKVRGPDGRIRSYNPLKIKVQ